MKERHRTQFLSKLPKHNFTKMWNISNIGQSLNTLSKQYLDEYPHPVHCSNPRGMECS